MPNPKADEDEKAYIARFMGDAAMVEKYPDEKQRYAVAISKWESRKDNAVFTSLAITMNAKMVQNKELDGISYSVVPAVILKEGVLNGSVGPLFYPMTEIQKTVEAWNHKPVFINHPKLNGKPASSCDEQVLAEQKVGFLLNSRVENGKLKVDVWLDTAKTDKVAPTVSEAVAKGKMVEVSTGLFTDERAVDNVEGVPAPTHNGKQYRATVHNFRPDHLAVLVGEVGALSIKDGAGLCRTNAEGDPIENGGPGSGPHKGAYSRESDQKKRRDIAIKDDAKSMKSLWKQMDKVEKLPPDSPDRARFDKEYSAKSREFEAKYGITYSDYVAGVRINSAAKQNTQGTPLMSKFTDLMRTMGKLVSAGFMPADAPTENASFRAVEKAVLAELRDEWCKTANGMPGAQTRDVYIRDIDENTVTYVCCTYGADGNHECLCQQDYTYDEATGEVELTTEPVEVVEQTVYAVKPPETDELDNIMENAVKPVEPKPATKPENQETKPVTIQEFLAQATPEEKATVENALAAMSREEEMKKAKRDAAKAGCKSNSALTLTDEQLDAMPTDVLEQLAVIKPAAVPPPAATPIGNAASAPVQNAVTALPLPTLDF